MKNLVLLFVTVCSLCAAQSYTARSVAEGGVNLIQLRDTKNDVEVTIVPSFGNRAVHMIVHGKDILYFPYQTPSAFQQKPDLNGIPFLAPWANRLDGSSYWANGKQYRLNPDLKNYQIGNAGLPIHGLLTNSPLWEVADMGGDAESAYVTSKLPFFKYPELMEQWPFAQEYEMTYRLSNGELEVRTTIHNRSAAPIPVAIGFHPYYRIPDKPRDEWTAQVPFRQAVVTNNDLVPTGELKASDLTGSFSLKGRKLDNGYTDLERDAQGRAHFIIESGEEKIQILFGPNYPVVVLWEPPARNGAASEFFCIEPMTGVTDAINLAHEGKYSGLQSVAPGGTWTESFWIKPIGF